MKNNILGLFLVLLLSACITSKATNSPFLISEENELSENKPLSGGNLDQAELVNKPSELSVIESSGIAQGFPTPYIELQYRLQPGSPMEMSNFIHQEAGCDWMGVGGQIFDLYGNPVTNLVVNLEGSLDGKKIDLISLTGGTLNLGPGGYEFKLADRPKESDQTLQLTLYDAHGIPLSYPVYFSTSESCEKNFVLVNFMQMWVVINGQKTMLPFVSGKIFP